LQKIIDAHIHLSERQDDDLNRFAKANGLGYTLDSLLGDMRTNGVEHGLLLSPPLHGSGPLPNEDVMRLCRRSQGMLSPVVTVEPTKKEAKAAVDFAEVNRKDVKGFKVRLGYVKASADSSVFNALYDYAEAEDLPVLFHTGDTASDTGTSPNHTH